MAKEELKAYDSVFVVFLVNIISYPHADGQRNAEGRHFFYVYPTKI